MATSTSTVYISNQGRYFSDGQNSDLIEPKAGVHFTKVTPTRSSSEFADFILQIAAHYSAADTIHLIVDNLSTHTRKALTDRFGEKDGGWLWDRFTVRYTPKRGSGLSQAEIEIGIFSRQCLEKRRIGDIAKLRRQAKAWNRRANQDKARIKWKFTETGSPKNKLLIHAVIVLVDG